MNWRFCFFANLLGIILFLIIFGFIYWEQQNNPLPIPSPNTALTDLMKTHQQQTWDAFDASFGASGVATMSIDQGIRSNLRYSILQTEGINFVRSIQYNYDSPTYFTTELTVQPGYNNAATADGLYALITDILIPHAPLSDLEITLILDDIVSPPSTWIWDADAENWQVIPHE